MAARCFMSAAAAAVALTASAADAENFPRRVQTSSAETVGSFLDSVGVNTHWNYSDTPYAYAYAEVSRLLIASGIRHMRAGCEDDAVLDLWRRGRVQSMVSFEPDYGSIQAQVNCVKTTNATAGGRAIDSIEGANEPDLFWAPRRTKTYQGRGFPEGPRLWQRDIYNALTADPATNPLPVIGFSFGVTYGSQPAPYDDGELAPFVDWGNFHPYPGGGNPFSPRDGYAGLSWYHNDATNPGVNVAELPFAFNSIGRLYRPKPMASSETGYSTYDDGSSETVHAIYMPRLFAEYFRVGIRRTFSYEFMDAFRDPEGDDQGSNFGLVRNDLTPKPAYFAMKALMTRLRATEDDPSVSSPDRELRITVASPSGYDRTEYVRHLLLEREDGGYALLLWHEISAEDKNKRGAAARRLSHPDMDTRVEFSVPAASAKLYRYDARWQLSRTNSYTNTSAVTVPVSEKLSILFFR